MAAVSTTGFQKQRPPGSELTYELQVRNSRILVVDDLIANVTLLENVLSRLGYKQIKSLTDPRQALSTVAEWQPDLIVLDLAMPHLNGFSIMAQLRENVPKEQWIPVLVLTADTDPATKRKALAGGATEFLPKPFDSSEIVLRIRNLLFMRILHKELRDHNHLLEERVAKRTASLSERTAELEQALAELKQAQKQVVQQERFRAFGEMAGGVAHDFNNVLMCVIGYTDLLLNDPTIMQEPETVEKFLRTMNSAGHDASRIVGRLRDFYRPREENEILTSIDLNKLFEDVVSLTQPKWKAQALASGRVINIRTDFARAPLAHCNPAEMREVVVNLIFNAVDAMPDGGSITLRTRVVGGTVSLGVSDSGTGMTEETRLRCMEPFYSTKGESGTGLGLSTVFGIVKRHEGTVEIESEVSRGTTFWIHLTMKDDNEIVDDEGLEAPVVPLRILAVDDEPVVRDVLGRYLEADGHAVSVAADGAQALRLLQERDFDLLIADQAMPGMTGRQLIAAVHARMPGMPVLLLSGCSDPALAAALEEPNITVVTNKALSQRGLRALIARAMAGSRGLAPNGATADLDDDGAKKTIAFPMSAAPLSRPVA
jgi:signal transduction histidine kinase